MPSEQKTLSITHWAEADAHVKNLRDWAQMR